MKSVLPVDGREAGLPRWVQLALNDLRKLLISAENEIVQLNEQIMMLSGKSLPDSDTFLETDDGKQIGLGRQTSIEFHTTDGHKFTVQTGENGALHVDTGSSALVVQPVARFQIQVYGR